MGAVQTVNTATFESVWATLDRITLRQEETDRIIRENAKEQKERADQLDRQMEETDRRISRLGNRIGELIEHFASPNLLEKFEEFDYEFTSISRNIIIKNKRKEHLAEIDILLEDGDYAMVVEVKSLLNKNDVIEHQQRMKIVREYADKRSDKRKFLAAVAAATVDSAAREYALESGIYVIEQTGETVRIKAPPSLACW